MKRKFVTMVAGLAALAVATLMVSVTLAAAGGAHGGVEDRGDGRYGTLAEITTGSTPHPYKPMRRDW